MVSNDVLILTNDGYYRQAEGVSMGSAVVPLLINIFFSKFETELSSFSVLNFRYVDDIIRTIRKGGKDYLLNFVNTMHEKLRFTVEPINNKIDIVDLEICICGHTIFTKWYRKPTDTGVLMKFHWVAPELYEKA